MENKGITIENSEQGTLNSTSNNTPTVNFNENLGSSLLKGNKILFSSDDSQLSPKKKSSKPNKLDVLNSSNFFRRFFSCFIQSWQDSSQKFSEPEFFNDKSYEPFHHENSFSSSTIDLNPIVKTSSSSVSASLIPPSKSSDEIVRSCSIINSNQDNPICQESDQKVESDEVVDKTFDFVPNEYNSLDARILEQECDETIQDQDKRCALCEILESEEFNLNDEANTTTIFECKTLNDFILYLDNRKLIIYHNINQEKLFEASRYLYYLESNIQNFLNSYESEDKVQHKVVLDDIDKIIQTLHEYKKIFLRDSVLTSLKIKILFVREFFEFFHLEHLKSFCYDRPKAISLGENNSDNENTLISTSQRNSPHQHLHGLRKFGKKLSFGRRTSQKKLKFRHKLYSHGKKQKNDEGWIREKGKFLDLWYRLENNSSVTVKVRGRLPCKLFEVLAILNETDLAGNWAPMFKYAIKEYQITRASQLVRQVFDYPILGQKESVMYCFGINALDTCGSVMIFCRSPPENNDTFLGLTLPKKGKISRVQSANLCFFLYPILHGEKTILEMYANFTHGIKFVPLMVVTYVVKKIAAEVFISIAKQCKNFSSSEYEERVQKNSDFYDWVKGLIIGHYSSHSMHHQGCPFHTVDLFKQNEACEDLNDPPSLASFDYTLFND